MADVPRWLLVTSIENEINELMTEQHVTICLSNPLLCKVATFFRCSTSTYVDFLASIVRGRLSGTRIGSWCRFCWTCNNYFCVTRFDFSHFVLQRVYHRPLLAVIYTACLWACPPSVRCSIPKLRRSSFATKDLPSVFIGGDHKGRCVLRLATHRRGLGPGVDEPGEPLVLVFWPRLPRLQPVRHAAGRARHAGLRSPHLFINEELTPVKVERAPGARPVDGEEATVHVGGTDGAIIAERPAANLPCRARDCDVSCPLETLDRARKTEDPHLYQAMSPPLFPDRVRC